MKQVKVEKDQELIDSNEKAYSADSVVSSDQVQINYQDGKKKFILETTYKNGAKKQKIIGMKKGNKIIFDKGVDWEKEV